MLAITIMLYFVCSMFALVFGLLTYALWTGQDLEGPAIGTTIPGLIAGIVTLALAVLCLSPIFYEYPDYLRSTNSLIMEYGSHGQLIEHPNGAFCLEGNRRFITVPNKNDSIPVWGRLQDRWVKTAGYVRVCDYEKFLAARPRFVDLYEVEDYMRAIVLTAMCMIDLTPSTLTQLDDPSNHVQQAQCCAYLDTQVNSIVSEYGLIYKATGFDL